MHQVIHIHPAAPVKPPEGAPCNGCGVCCLAEPCPVGMLVSRKRSGACATLVWSADAGRYHCGLMLAAGSEAVEAGAVASGAVGPVATKALPRWPRPVRALALRWVRRLISAGSGCDACLEVASSGGHETGERTSAKLPDGPREDPS